MLVRFHLDEHIQGAVAAALRQHGIDVTTTIETSLLQLSDDRHRAFALQEHRVIVTRDADYLRFHQQGLEHAGIAFWPGKRRELSGLVRNLVTIWRSSTAEEMHGKIQYV